MRLRLISVALLVALTACGGGDSEPTPSATDDAAALKKAIPTITKTVKITEDNDPNGDIGRPGKYSQAVSVYDSRTECDEPLDITCGAKIEVFDSKGDAEARSKYILDALKAVQMLGSEYHYINGASLLRVSGDIKPSQAKAYKAAFTKN